MKYKKPFFSQKYRTILTTVGILFLSFCFPSYAIAGPSSTHYEIREYGFGAGGTNGSTSTNYSLFGLAGESDQGNPSSTNYAVNAGLTYTIISNVPPAPTLTNPSNYYSKLHLVINNGGNPTDTKFAIEISTDAFASVIKYVKNDNTVGTTLASTDWQTYTTWGGASGFNIINLSPGVTYTTRVAAQQGNYTQSPYGPNSASVATINPTMTFSVSPNSVTMASVTPATVNTAGTTVTTNVSTNAVNGATIWVSDNNQGLLSTIGSHTINAVSNDLGSISEGYGLRGTATSQTSGGPMEILSPYNGAGNNVGSLTTNKQTIFDSSGAPVTTGQATFEIKVKPSVTAPATNDYTDIITIVAAGSF